MMRYIDLDDVLASIPDTVLAPLQAADESMASKTDAEKIAFAANGNSKWSPTKASLAAAGHNKCWYTESKNPGSHNDVEHFRPKGKVTDKDSDNIVHWYWFLAFNPINYRFSCEFSNRKTKDPDTGVTGGKGDDFPLLNNTPHATCFTEIDNEDPVLLDPCNEADVALLAFQPDGQPVVADDFKGDPIACYRVDKSNLLLNLDHPTFKEEREALYNRIKELIERGNSYEEKSGARNHVIQDLRTLISAESSYSKAAESYIRCFRNEQWIEELL